MRHARRFPSLLLSALSAFAWSTASAVTIVDTGPPDLALLIEPGAFTLAGRFTTTQPWSITSVGAWFANYESTPGTFHVAIYSNGGVGLPADELFFTEIDMPVNNDSLEFLSDDGLDWDLLPGRYWLVFSVTDGCDVPQRLSCFLGVQRNHGLKPAAYRIDEGEWSRYPHGPTAVIEANPVPIPAGLWLFGSALVGLWSSRPRHE